MLQSQTRVTYGNCQDLLTTIFRFTEGPQQQPERGSIW